MYDLIIIGAGPAGLSASVYASRFKLKHLVIGQLTGGIISEATEVENYLGFNSISGFKLAKKFQEHAEKLGGKIIVDEVIGINKINKNFEVVTESGGKYQSRSIILALGTRRRKLNIPGEEKFIGKGVSYCAVCDAGFFKEKTVAVIGGSNSAVQSAFLLSLHAKKVYLIYRKEKLRAHPVVVDKIKNNPKIEIIYRTNVIEIKGDQKVSSVILDNEYQKQKELKLEGVFIEIGFVPAVSLAKDLGVEIDSENYIKIDPSGKTNIPGIYAAGDITAGLNKLRQIITAAAEGAVAAESVYQYLNH